MVERIPKRLQPTASGLEPPDFTLFADARPLCRSGDLMVLNRKGAIGLVGRGDASHVGCLAWRHADQNSLSVAESREGVGARVVSLEEQVRLYPGLIDVLTPIDECPDALRERAATIAYNWSGHGYDYPGILRRLLVHSPIAYATAHALGYDPDLTDMTPSPWRERKVCSGMYPWAYRWAKWELAGVKFNERKIPINQIIARNILQRGWDPCPNLGDRWIEPCDLVRSAGFRRVATRLVHEEDVWKLQKVKAAA